MFLKATPESVGVPSSKVLKYLKMLDSHEISAHSVLMARGDKLFCEAYWKPFERSTKHRMYSQTKSYVGLAVRLLADEGRISLEDKIISYFPEKLPETVSDNLKELSIRNMLMMRTCFDEHGINWFTSGTDDRVKLYFSQPAYVYPGTQYNYDSAGSFVLAALVEKLTGKIFLDYLRDKCLREIGFSEDAYCLKCPGGYSWGDSALICTPYDMLLYGRFVGKYGEWEGKQIIPRSIFEDAFNDVSDTFTCSYRSYGHCGYMSQFWKFYGNSIAFSGMHDQFTVYDPDTDITFTCTSGNYRSNASRDLMVSYLFSEIFDEAGEVLPENEAENGKLEEYIATRKLITMTGNKFSPLENEVSGVVFAADENKCGISEFSFDFEDDFCDFHYKNEQGEKTLRLGRGENIFQQFPQTGYSHVVGGTDCEGHTYKCAGSFAWGTENQMNAKVHIIDEYIGVLFICFSYRNGHARIRMDGDAENFLTEYNGLINAVKK